MCNYALFLNNDSRKISGRKDCTRYISRIANFWKQNHRSFSIVTQIWHVMIAFSPISDQTTSMTMQIFNLVITMTLLSSTLLKFDLTDRGQRVGSALSGRYDLVVFHSQLTILINLSLAFSEMSIYTDLQIFDQSKN